jgi:transposase
VEQFMTPRYGRAPRGERVVIPQPGRRFKRVNVIAGWHSGNKKFLAPTVYSWNTNAAWFLIWLEFFLCPLLKKGTIIVLDNARFHKAKKVMEIAKFYGCFVSWLPKYSPDLNPIEKCWASFKNWLRLYSKHFHAIQDAILSYFQSK